MNDPKQVITNLSKRWLAKYGETIGTEEIRRHLSRLLTEYQKKEIEAVFSNWSGEELLSAINATFDLDDGAGEVRREVVSGLVPPSIPADIEYLPRDDQAEIERRISDLPFSETVPAKKPRGRPRKVK